jgi:hypothetical protein
MTCLLCDNTTRLGKKQRQFKTKLLICCVKLRGRITPRNRAVSWLRRLVAGLPQRRLGFDPGSVHVGFVVDKVALGQGFPRVLRFYPVIFIPPVLHYKEKRKKLIIFITVLQNKPQGCGALHHKIKKNTSGPVL